MSTTDDTVWNTTANTPQHYERGTKEGSTILGEDKGDLEACRGHTQVQVDITWYTAPFLHISLFTSEYGVRLISGFAGGGATDARCGSPRLIGAHFYESSTGIILRMT